MRTLTRLGLGVTAVVAALSLTACGGENKADGPASLNGGKGNDKQSAADADVPKDPKAAMLKYAACMRENGVDFPDPEGDGGMSRAIPMEEGSGAMEKMEKAGNACKKFLPKSDYNPDDPKEKDKRAKQNQCLREKGIDVTDPQGGNGGTIKLDGDKEKLEKAMKECGLGTGGAASVDVEKK